MADSTLDALAKTMFGERNATAEQAEADALRTFEQAQAYLEQLEDKRRTMPFDRAVKVGISSQIEQQRQYVKDCESAWRKAANETAGLRAAAFVQNKEQELEKERQKRAALQPIPPSKEEQEAIDRTRENLVRRYRGHTIFSYTFSRSAWWADCFPASSRCKEAFSGPFLSKYDRKYRPLCCSVSGLLASFSLVPERPGALAGKRVRKNGMTPNLLPHGEAGTYGFVSLEWS